jgi:cytochrome c
MNKMIAIVLGLATVWGTAQAEPCVSARGQQVFESKCAMCHAAKREQGHLVGPNLFGVVGRAVGKAAGFQYSPALADAKDRWDEKTLDLFLKAPASARPGTTMPFTGLRNDRDRAAVMCFLGTQTQ